MKFKHLSLFFILFSCGKEQSESTIALSNGEAIPKLEANNFETHRTVEQKIQSWLNNGNTWKWSDLTHEELFAAIELSDGEFAVGLKLQGETDSLPFQDLSKRREWENLREEILKGLEDTLTVEMGREVRREDFVLEVDLHLPIVSFHSKSPALVAWLMSSEHIRYIEPLNDVLDNTVNRTESGCTAAYNPVQASDYTTTGTTAKISWHWYHHNVPQAWGIRQGMGIGVGVIDAGVSSNQYLLFQQFNSGYSNVNRAHETTNTLGSSPYTSCNHGNAMAGLIAAPWASFSNTIGGAHKASLYTVRASNDVLLNTSAERLAVKNAYVYLANKSAVKIISMSMGTPFYSSVLLDAVSYASAMGKLLFAAAGTSTFVTSAFGVIYPAAFTECQAVTGINDQNQTCQVCHDGPQVDFTIVMERSWDVNRKAVGINQNNEWPQYIGGSSAATASAAAIAAIVWSVKPTLSRFQLLWILRYTAQYPVLPDSHHGYGKMNALSAVQLAQQY
jgi:subtilisin family serine protease